MVGFGLSKTYWEIILSRIAQGMLNGNIGVVKCVTAEMTDETNAALGYAFFGTIWSLGTTLGPIIGGVLADPAQRWPDTLGRSRLLTDYPYFLPCITVASVSMSAFLFAFLGLRETLRRSHSAGSSPAEPVTQGDEKAATPITDLPELPSQVQTAQTLSSSEAVIPSPQVPGFRSLFVPRVLYPLLNYGFIAFVDQCYEVLQPLMYSTSIGAQGLGFSTFTIGIIIGVWGVVNCIVEIFVFPPLVRKVGPRTLYIASFACYLVCLSAFPLMAFLAQRAGHIDKWTWLVLVIQLAVYTVAYMGYGCVFLFVNTGAPRGALGAANGLAQTTASTMRAIAPTAASSLFAASIEKNLLRGTLVYWVLCAVVLAGIYTSTMLPKRLYT
ncbi:MFS general substrate transporter [Punctularia strigosozonata HHB-11173 SS5]|uniref:MFS general substrate transporter n=1 Tax=Punctularia strigosozonata (strain HHB-11173) TaxID=741275 RepID=R7S2N8_PUNST|nr:MFS general substrate transporter [Punctularia strigosozonata HHB-11173 SS5]EIN04052.1 MFS general substrate transporter [Punctularia strigosozonata HHB-11173 SS5]